MLKYWKTQSKAVGTAALDLPRRTRPGSYLVEAADGAGLSEMREEWEDLASASPDFLELYQSPAWWDYASANPNALRSIVGVTRGLDGRIDAVAPTQILDLSFSLGLVQNIQVTQPLRVARVLGSQPLVRAEATAYAQMFCFLLESNQDCDGVWLSWLPFESRCWRAISGSPGFQHDIIVHLPGRPDPYSLVDLPASFEAYLSRLKGKTRYNLRRQLNRLREREGELRSIRVTDAAQLPWFLAAASEINSRARVYRRTGWRIGTDAAACRRLAALANRGILRGYLLSCGGHFRAFAFGYQYRDTFYYHRIGFDDRLAAYSPGTALLYLLLEDLFRHRPPRRVNLGTGGAWKTGPFGTDLVPGTEVLLLRRSLKNRLWVSASTLHQIAKHVVRRGHWPRGRCAPSRR